MRDTLMSSSAALTLAHNIVHLLDNDVEDVSAALAILANGEGPVAELAQDLISAERDSDGGSMADIGTDMWAAWDAGLLECAPDHVSDGTGIATGRIWWEGVASEQQIRSAVAS
jgi:hypothetical protein